MVLILLITFNLLLINHDSYLDDEIKIHPDHIDNYYFY